MSGLATPARRQTGDRPARPPGRLPHLHARGTCSVRDGRPGCPRRPLARLPLVRRRPQRRGALPQQRGQGGSPTTSRQRHVHRQHARRTAAATRTRSTSPARTRSACSPPRTCPSDDIVLKLIGPGGSAVASSDTATSPEAVNYTGNGGKVADGTYHDRRLRVQRPDRPGQRRQLRLHRRLGGQHRGGRAEHGRQPVMAYFGNAAGGRQPDRRAASSPPPAATSGSTTPPRAARGTSTAATGTPTFTTQGNNARTAEARTNPLAPARSASCRPRSRASTSSRSATSGRPPSAIRRRSLVPGSGADVSAAVTNLFAGHNRFHDYAYHLGFTELNYNMQQSNFGVARDGDPELGNVQAGAVTGGAPSYLGRDNANQITLNDGIPGITNQYLFQPIAAALLRPVRRRRPRHVGVRPRVHARDLQPHGRRPRRRAHRVPGRSDGRELVGPRRARVPARARPAVEPGSRART